MPGRGPARRPSRRGRSMPWSRRSWARRSSTWRCASSVARPPGESPDHGVLDAIEQPYVSSRSGWRRPRCVCRGGPFTCGGSRAGGAVGQRAALPEFRGISDGSAFDLPGPGLRPAPRGPRPRTTRPACSSPITRSDDGSGQTAGSSVIWPGAGTYAPTGGSGGGSILTVRRSAMPCARASPPTRARIGSAMGLATYAPRA